MSAADTKAAEAKRRGPGRPASDAPERIVEAAYGILKGGGYAGLTTAKVAAASGQNKALISYYFGSKQGLVSAVARRVSSTIVEEVLAHLDKPSEPAEFVERLAEGVWGVMDRDEGLQRVYFDLASQSVVSAEVGEILGEIKQSYRSILRELLGELPRAPAPADVDGIVVFLIAGLEGLALERLERGETPELVRARDLFVRLSSAAIAPGG